MYDLLAIVVNYNSRGIINIEKRLLQGLDKLNNAVSLKLVLVDNHSTDGSFEDLYMYARDNLNLEIIPLRLSKNYGFVRAVNIAYRYATKRWKFKYLAILNNDIIIVPENIPKLLSYLEYGNIAGVQGTIMQMQNPRLVDNAGFLIDRYGLTYPVCRGYTIDCARLYTPSYLSGACSFYRIDVIDKTIGKPFDEIIESYFDDKYLGLLLWNSKYRLIHVPLISAYHYGTFSYGSMGKKVIKGKKWFEGIIQAELISMNVLGTNIIVKATYLLSLIFLSSLISIVTRQNYVNSLLKAYKNAKYYIRSRKLKIDKKNIPYILSVAYFRSITKGIKVRKVYY